jgi:hypothetical protein
MYVNCFLQSECSGNPFQAQQEEEAGQDYATAVNAAAADSNSPLAGPAAPSGRRGQTRASGPAIIPSDPPHILGSPTDDEGRPLSKAARESAKRNQECVLSQQLCALLELMNILQRGEKQQAARIQTADVTLRAATSKQCPP